MSVVDEKREMQLRGVVLRFEKKHKIWPPSYLGDGEHQNSLDGIEDETRRFHIRIRLGIPCDFHAGGAVIYDITDKKTDEKFKVKHYFPNKDFDNTYGWKIEGVD